MITKTSLWGEEFFIDTSDKTNAVLEKINNPKEVSIKKSLESKKLAIPEKINLIQQEVDRVLGNFKKNTLIIRDKQTFIDYINKAIKNGIIAIDTETNNSLDPLTCKLMGACIYTPNSTPAYIPVNHVDFYTGQLLDRQLTEKDIREQFQRLVDNKVKIVFHNAKFDYQVIKMTCGIALPIYWDTLIGAHLIDENGRHGLKELYVDLIDKSQAKYSIEKLFGNVPYAYLPPELFGIYSAADPYETYELFEWQRNYFNLKENSGLFRVFKEVEIPLIEVTAEMELTGITFDFDYAERLRQKYVPKRDALEKLLYEQLSAYQSKIDAWRNSEDAQRMVGKKRKSEQLDDPIKVTSPTQLAIFIYDVLKTPPVDNKQPRGTGEDILKKLKDKYDFCKTILEYRELNKLIDTYIEKLPKSVGVDGRIHCNFNQIGTDTGRYSSSNPNLQNIPSGNHEIRLLFKASDNNMIVGCDYSSQEPKILSYYAGEESMKNIFKEKKDIYAYIAQLIYNNNYEDNLEFYPEGKHIIVDGEEVVCGYKTHKNIEGKARRGVAKILNLAVSYGMGVASISTLTKKTIEESQQLLDAFFNKFPKIKQWIDHNLISVRKYGYVEDFMGRRRHLPDVNLPLYDAEYQSGYSPTETDSNFNPFLICEDREDTVISSWKKKCAKIKTKQEFNALSKEANNSHINLITNSSKIATAERQATNARVQGGAATLTKTAMNNIYRDKELNELGFKLMITVHDEVLGECPKENADRVVNRLSQVMIDSAKPYMDVPMQCDGYIVPCWYYDELTAEVQKEYDELLKEHPQKEAEDIIRAEHIELLESQLDDMLNLTN